LPACWIAGPYRHCRPLRRAVGWAGLGPTPPDADRRQHRVSRGPGDRWSRPSLVRGPAARIAGPSQCSGSPAPRGCAGLGVTGPSALCQSFHLGTTVDALSAKLASGLCRPTRGPAASGVRTGRHRTCQPQSPLTAPTGQWPVPCSPFHPASGPLTSGRTSQTRMRSGQPDLAATTTRGHVTPRPDP
jgi:hypothetical protein